MTSIADNEAGSSVRAKLNNLFPVAPTINATGSFGLDPALLVIPPIGLKIGATYIEPSGSWLESFYCNDTAATLVTAEFADLVGVRDTVLDFGIASASLLASAAFPTLVYVGGTVHFEACPQLVSLDLSSLVCAGAVALDNLALLEELNFTALRRVTLSFAPSQDLPALTTITLPVLERLGGGVFLSSNTAAVTEFTIGASLKSVGDDVSLTSCALIEASVDNILVRLAALDGTGGTISYDNKNVTITGTSAPPSATGLTAKTTLEGRGNAVTVNS